MKTKKFDIKSYVAKFILLLLVIGAGTFSCKQENDDPMPEVTNFRVVEKDSSITSGAFGLYIAIQGKNLQNVQEVWFNDLKAYLNPNFITSSNIICAIPNQLPGEILNKIKLVTGGGKVYTTDFRVDLPKPVVKGLYNEMAAPGSVTQVLGDYLFFIKSVKIGDKDAEILSTSEHAISIRIPADAQQGTFVTVEAEGGTVISTFKYQDAGMWLFDFDTPATSWNSIACWGGMKMRSDDESLKNQYGYIVETNLPPSDWNNDWVTSTCWFDYGYNKVNLTEKVLKFEINAKEPWVYDSKLKDTEHAFLQVSVNGKTYDFKPELSSNYRTDGFKTEGWMTVTVPFTSFTFTDLKEVTINDFQLVFKTSKQTYEKFATYVDNFRICTPTPAN